MPASLRQVRKRSPSLRLWRETSDLNSFVKAGSDNLNLLHIVGSDASYTGLERNMRKLREERIRQFRCRLCGVGTASALDYRFRCQLYGVGTRIFTPSIQPIKQVPMPAIQGWNSIGQPPISSSDASCVGLERIVPNHPFVKVCVVGTGYIWSMRLWPVSTSGFP